MAYCTVSNVRMFCNLTPSDISDSDISDFIKPATTMVNGNINIRVVREQVRYIDGVRTNKVDGSNSTYYIQNWEKGFLSDANDDGTVDTTDITVTRDRSNVETNLTISSIDTTTGAITLSAAPAGGDILYITYHYAHVSTATPDFRVTQATAYMTGSLIYTGIDAKKVGAFTVGKMKVAKQSPAFTIYKELAMVIINNIRKFPLYKIEGRNYTDLITPTMSLRTDKEPTPNLLDMRNRTY